MVASTLQQLDEWYNEPSAQAGDRPQLLSKLALLELCGWIEGEFDRLMIKAEGGRLKNQKWFEKDILERTSGFTYTNHFRRMIVGVFGELFTQRIEVEMESRFPGELERLTNILKELWLRRCSFAHADYSANVAAQKVFDAPSWTRGQLITVTELIGKFDAAVTTVVAAI